jgi:hypothetical protein
MKLVLYSLPNGVITEKYLYLAFPIELVLKLALSRVSYGVITEN